MIFSKNSIPKFKIIFFNYCRKLFGGSSRKQQQNNLLGVGTDIVQIHRIERILKLYGNHFKNRILGKEEIQALSIISVSKHANFLAKRFAAKEAVSKALGSGISGRTEFKDIIILNDALGKPYVRINPAKLHRPLNVDISLSDDYPIAIAFAVISNINY